MPDDYKDVMDVGNQPFRYRADNYFLPNGLHEIHTRDGTLSYRVAEFLSGHGYERGDKLYFSRGILVTPVDVVPLTLFGPLPYQKQLEDNHPVVENGHVILADQPRLFE